MTNDELIAAALSEENDDYWDYVMELHKRGTQDVFQAAIELCKSEKSDERALGADILGQLGYPEKPFTHESVDILLDMLSKEEDVNSLNSIIAALGHLEDSRAVELIAQFQSHRDEKIRLTVAHALGHYNDDIAISALIRLSSDEVRDVRDWATFYIANNEDVDSPEIREVLWKASDDEDNEIRAEALYGLARRGEKQIVERLIKELTLENSIWYDAIEAAQAVADPRLYPALVELRDVDDIDISMLEDAIDACRGDYIEDESQVEWGSIERVSSDDVIAIINNVLKDQFSIEASLSMASKYTWLYINFNDDFSVKDRRTATLNTWDASWSISNESGIIISSRNFHKVGEEKAACLVGHRVTYVHLTPKSKMLKIGFDSGLLLKISPSSSADDRHSNAWSFYSYETQEVSMWCNGMIYRERDFSEEESTEENGG